jgi:hypothetical protein
MFMYLPSPAEEKQNFFGFADCLGVAARRLNAISQAQGYAPSYKAVR